MAQFIGKWKNDCSTYKNYEEFAKKSGFPDDMIEQFKNDESTGEFKKDGDTWTCHFVSQVAPEKNFVFKSGVETETDFMGKKVLYTITFESDTKMTEVEKSEYSDFKPVIMTREVKGDTMLCVYTLDDGTQMSNEMKRV